jgi:hypothetical protein
MAEGAAISAIASNAGINSLIMQTSVLAPRVEKPRLADDIPASRNDIYNPSKVTRSFVRCA